MTAIPESHRTKPNLLFIMADQMRADAMSIAGGAGSTPNLDNLARQGRWFTNCVTNSPVCVPARISLATGCYPHQTGVSDHMRCTLSPHAPTWMQGIRSAGYTTALFGKTHLHPHEGDLRDRTGLVHDYGFDVVSEVTGPWASMNTRSDMTDEWEQKGLWDGYRADLEDRMRGKRHVARASSLGLDDYYDVFVARQAKEWLACHGTSDAPWFCCVSFGGPHEPWDAPEPFASAFDPKDMAEPIARANELGDGAPSSLHALMTTPSQANPSFAPGDVPALRANYAGLVALIDSQVGELLTILDEAHLSQNTVVVFTADHGEMNGDHGLLFKSNLLDPAMFVPLIIRGPGQLAVREAGEPSDALVELMDVGATLLDYAGGEEDPISSARSVRTIVEDGSEQIREAVVAELKQAIMILTHEWKMVINGHGETSLLYDRQQDPLEQTNLAGHEHYAALEQDLAFLVAAHRAQTPVPLPRDAANAALVLV